MALPKTRSQTKLKKMAPRTRGRPRLEDINKLNDHILLIARSTFFELGYAGATLDLIAQRARISKSTIFSRFQGKQGLFEAVIKYSIDEWSEGAKHHERDESSTLEAMIRHHAEVHVRAMVDSDLMNLVRLMEREAQVLPNLGKVMLERSKVDRVDAVSDKIRHFADVDGIPCRDPDSAVTAFRAMISQQVLDIQVMQQPFGPEEQRQLIDRVVELFLASRPVW